MNDLMEKENTIFPIHPNSSCNRKMENDPFEHIGDIHSSYNKNHAVPSCDAQKGSNEDVMMFRKNPSDQLGALAHRPLLPEVHSAENPFQDGNDDDIKRLLDPTIGYVRRASVVIPVEMMLNGMAQGQVDHETGGDESSNDGLHGPNSDLTSAEAAPTYSIKRSRLTLYAAFPPPPIILTRNRDGHLNNKSLHSFTAQEVISANQRLKHHSGFHGAVGFTSATCHEHGYADTMLSLNYRLPKLISFPAVTTRDFKTVGNLHCNLHFGAHTGHSMGATVSSLDEKSSVCVDVGNRFITMNQSPSRFLSKAGIPPHRLDLRHYTISASRDIGWGRNPFRIESMVMLSPISRHDRIKSRQLADSRPRFAVAITNLNSFLDSPSSNKSKQFIINERPKLSVSLGYGRDGCSWYHFPQSGMYLPEIDATREENITSSTFPAAYSTSLKVDVKQQISTLQTSHFFVTYRRLGQSLSLGTIITRTFSSSALSRLGVGVRHIFENIWDRKLWKQGKTIWLLQLERGDASFCIPIAICPLALTTWDSCIRIFYASLVSIIVDAIVAELLCNATSVLRVKFLRLLSRKGYTDEIYLRYAMHGAKTEEQQDEERWRREHIARAFQDALKQRNSMEKQARHIAEKEEDQHGLVITKAIYGVMDSKSHEWILPRNDSDESFGMCALDATIPLQFWVSNGSLRIPSGSKKHMLGFYNVLDFVSNEDCTSNRPPLPSNTNLDIEECPNMIRKVYQWCKRQWHGPPKKTETLRDLVAVLSVRYKYEDKLFDAIFFDNEAVELPCSRAQEVLSETTTIS